MQRISLRRLLLSATLLFPAALLMPSAAQACTVTPTLNGGVLMSGGGTCTDPSGTTRTSTVANEVFPTVRVNGSDYQGTGVTLNGTASGPVVSTPIQQGEDQGAVLVLENGATFTLTNSAINGTGQLTDPALNGMAMHGILNGSNGDGTLTDSTVTVKATSTVPGVAADADGIVFDGGGTLTITNSAITVSSDSGQAEGIIAASGTAGGAPIVTATDLTISAMGGGNGYLAVGVDAIGSTVNLTGGKVEAINPAGESALGIWASDGATANANGVTVTSTDTGAYITDSTLTLSDDNRSGTHTSITGNNYGVQAGSSNGAVDTTVTGTNASITAVTGSGVLLGGGTNVTLANTTVKGSSAGVESNGTFGSGLVDTVTIDGGNVTATNGSAFLVDGDGVGDTGNANITVKGGAQVSAGDGNILNVAQGGQATFTAEGETLNGNLVADAASTGDAFLNAGTTLTGMIQKVNTTVDPTSTWNVTADSTPTNLTNSGTIAFEPPVGGAYKTITTQNYVGNNGIMVLNTYLGADGSPSDKLVIDGGTARGTTGLTIKNTTGPGALTTANGILVIKAIDGATVDPNAFHLTGAVAVGAFDYNLFQGGPAAANEGEDVAQSEYLRSIQLPTGPALNPSAQTALPYPDILTNFALSTLGTLQQRTGNRIWPNGEAPPETVWCKDPAQNFHCRVSADQSSYYAGAHGAPMIYGAGAWGRIGGQYASYDPKAGSGSSYTQGLGFLQAGYEGVAYENAYGQLTAGLFATIGTSNARIKITNDPVTGAARADGKITSTGYGIGGNLTWLGNNGFYADGIAQFIFYDSSLSNKAGDNNQGWSSVLSLEVGKRFDLGSGWAIVPQAQLAWAHVDFDSFTDINGSAIKLGAGDTLQGRAGLRVEKLASWQADDGSMRRMQLYGIANLTYNFLGGTKVDVAGTSLTQSRKKLWGEVGAGATYAWNDKWSAYGEADYATSLSKRAGKNYQVKGTVGLRYRW
ncbi:autotransporter family protein [Labrys neptuniae]